jgi:hypothetical protein
MSCAFGILLLRETYANISFLLQLLGKPSYLLTSLRQAHSAEKMRSHGPRE